MALTVAMVDAAIEVAIARGVASLSSDGETAEFLTPEQLQKIKAGLLSSAGSTRSDMGIRTRKIVPDYP